MPEGRRLRWALAIALLALVAVTGLLMMAKEQQMGQEISSFDGHSNLALAQAVARGDTQGIHAQATQDRLRERGDRQVTLLQWAVLSQQPGSVQALLDPAPTRRRQGWTATARCTPRRCCKTRSTCGCCWPKGRW